MERDYVRVQPTGLVYHFYIHDDIGPAGDYVDLLDALYTSGPEDNIILHLNTPGGYFNTVCEILTAIRASQAFVTTRADGEVASGGSLLLFAGDGIVIGDFCEVMLHDGSGGAGGKINENLRSAEANSRRFAKVYHSVYEPFFTEEEVDEILEGKDLYLLAEDVTERVQAVVENSAEQQELELEEKE